MVVGLAKIRNEEHIIGKTLDNWQQYCDGGFYIYDDCSTDRTVEICKAHPNVREVLCSDLMDPDRQRAEWYNRQILLQSARRFMGPDDWVLYTDADEFLYKFDASILDNPGAPPCIAAPQYDLYITPEDANGHYSERRWVGAEYEIVPFFYRNRFLDGWHKADQRNAMLRIPMQMPPLLGVSLHLGKGISPKHFDAKCKYYTDVFGSKYADKWEKRKGQGIREDFTSNFGTKLVLWQDVLDGKVETWHRDHVAIVD
uniref:Putative glycosyltransferase n=1 Tax=viral metagenome TaxID=1070528 RepID=A0A6M3J370_9ZZZZ